jgi:hypothetical protein
MLGLSTIAVGSTLLITNRRRRRGFKVAAPERSCAAAAMCVHGPHSTSLISVCGRRRGDRGLEV